MTTPTALWLPARAKLNLVLRIKGRRADGYHLLETLFHELALHDDLVVRLGAPGASVAVTAERAGLEVAAGDDNLVVQALHALRSAVGGEALPGLHAELHKRIPHGGGLGGGSSDAAAALRLGNALLGEALGRDELLQLAVTLGADVPFFLCGGSQWGRGVGDELTPAAVEPQHFVLLLPPFGCETAAVFKNHARWLEAGDAAASLSTNTVCDNRDDLMSSGYCNELEPAAEQLQPELGRLRRHVAEVGYPHVRMSGSGSTLFVAAGDEAAAERCRGQLERSLPEAGLEGVELLVTRSGPAAGSDAPGPWPRADRGTGDGRA